MALIDSQWERLLKKSRPSTFPDATLLDILSRLPVKSILRFKSVCKKWYALFGESVFVEAHLNRSMEASDGCYLARPRDYYDKETYSDGRALFSLRSVENFEEMCELHFESNPSSKYETIAAAGGIVCFVKYEGSPWCIFHFYIWNPATRELRILPKFLGQGGRSEHSLGFGFDPKHNDYKAVAITDFEDKDSYEVNVYSLRTDSWRVVEVDLTHKMLMETGRSYVNYRMHWLWRGPLLEWCIVSFDFSEEKIIEMDVPEFDPKNYAVLHESPASLGKSLFLCNFRIPPDGFQVWFMKEYGDSKSWTKLYYIPSHWVGPGCLCPWVYLDNGKIIMRCLQHLVLYDPENHVREDLNVYSGCNVLKYKESLVSVKGGGSFSDLNKCASIFDRSSSTVYH